MTTPDREQSGAPNPERDGGTLLVEDCYGQMRHATVIETRLAGDLAAANEALAMERKDAERYRWLRSGFPGTLAILYGSKGEELDATIDAALAADRQGAGGEGG